MSARPPDFPALKATPIYTSLSRFGDRIFLPQGVFYWADLAKKVDIDATVGDAKGSELNEFLDVVPADRSITFFVKNLADLLGPEIDASKITSYAPIAGLPQLRAQWKSHIIEKTGLQSVENIENLLSTPIVVTGVTNGVYLTLKFFINDGETVLITDKYWENYDTIINLNIGGKVDVFPMFKDQRFNIPGMIRKIEEIGKKQGKVVMLINFPNNPTGFSPTTEEMENIAQALIDVADKMKKPLIVLMDDAYEGYVYEETAEKKSLFSFLVDKHPMLVPIKLDGVSKQFLFYGGRVGFITFGFSSEWNVDLEQLDKDISNKISGAIRGTTSNSSHISQMLVLKLMEHIEETIKNRQKVFEVLLDRYNAFNAAAQKLNRPDEGIYFDPFGAGFFALLNLPPSIPAEQFARRLLDEQSLGVIPVQTKTGVNGIRIAFSSMSVANIEAALERIASLLQ
ncbi:MAG TPA: aminotransferase class I/II-fold pyridoxal phosphate-dependent enzyme [Candidatus Lokiarchaeia archaeon]|nr:aminotransferase class I/II-fold pyridoxal phosphate-dependent enzyme [Candidatus Lokiarchaeia archaeon]